MSKHKTTGTLVCNLSCAVLMLALLVMQFVPYWDCGDQVTSISQFIWLPSDHPEVKTLMKEQVDPNFSLSTDVVMPSVLILILCVAGSVFCIAKPKSGWISILPFACGLAGTIGYGTSAFLQVGTSWGLHLTVSLLILAVAAVSLVVFFTGKIRNK